ncbi:methylated-DNA--[protein]-cysteine S-methyltransferase [Micrococcus porci]|uniref:methylated-DNA--[protein]-cysteine S-methyltransferase n=1 Tax=Micrococcus TaxID=1269 RepID=UPI001CCBF30C|nr:MULTISPECIES: methylated-DNA--[protein]-cysteine S-methyltransferase [Micrococcus]MCG7422254.1 methylated-DNA--[protein]-cysteine S-methyltransferase [Micrococcus sp. ACRRV]UBH24573.1 methylated-DNA--[protein]-cysteine S-methyltransferase [Micrococcus porci]
MTHPPAFLPELRWTAATLPGTSLALVAVYSPEDDAVRASGVAVPEGAEPPAAAIGRLLLELMDRLEELAPETAAREMDPRPVEPREGLDQTVADALAAYAAGDVDALDGLAVVQPGTAFRQASWEALRSITPGSPVAYGELATRAGAPKAVRAAGGACAANLAAVVVPCHRVVPASGGVGSYLYGSAAKAALLAHEAAHAPA